MAKRAGSSTNSGRARGRGSRGGRAAHRNGRNVSPAVTIGQESDAVDNDPTLWSPDYSPFDTADHSKVINRRLRFIAEGEKTFGLAAIKQRQAQLKEFFENGAKVMLDRNRAHAGRGLRALEAPRSTLAKQPWFQELLRAKKGRRAADAAFHEHLLKTRLNAEEIQNAHVAERFKEAWEVSLWYSAVDYLVFANTKTGQSSGRGHVV